MSLCRYAAYALVLLSFLVATMIYNSMPETMVSHWGMQGEANGSMPKLFAVFLMPVISLVLLLLFEFLPIIDPMKKNYGAFMKEYELFVAGIIAFLFYLYLLTLAWNYGVQFNMSQALAPAFGVLLYLVGIVMEKAKRNWFVGVRTPWTMSSDAVWEKTHAFAGKLFKAAGALVFVGMLVPVYLFEIMFAGIMVAALVPVAYSYFEFRKQGKGKKN